MNAASALKTRYGVPMSCQTKPRPAVAYHAAASRSAPGLLRIDKFTHFLKDKRGSNGNGNSHPPEAKK